MGIIPPLTLLTCGITFMDTMKIYSKYLQLGAIALALTFGLSAYAETPREELVHAFRLLKRANADYAGHRAKAMAEVEAAGHELGLDLGGDLPEREGQWKSDAQLKEARKLLREARTKLEKADRERIASHVDVAVTELDEALKVK
jgi:hypothetical protein